MLRPFLRVCGGGGRTPFNHPVGSHLAIAVHTTHLAWLLVVTTPKAKTSNTEGEGVMHVVRSSLSTEALAWALLVLNAV